MKWWSSLAFFAAGALAHPHVLGDRAVSFAVTGSASLSETAPAVPLGTGQALEGSAQPQDDGLEDDWEVVVVTEITTATTTVCPEAEASATYTFPTEKLGPIATLPPVIPDHHDLYDKKHLVPCKEGDGAALHYAKDPEKGETAGIYVVANPQWKYPSVVLDYSGFIVQVEVSERGELVISFSDIDAFRHGQAHWDLEQIVFVTYIPNCGDFHKGERCYYRSVHIYFDEKTLTATAVGEACAIMEIIITVTVEWGSWDDGLSNPKPTISDGGAASHSGLPGHGATSARPTTSSSRAGASPTSGGSAASTSGGSAGASSSGSPTVSSSGSTVASTSTPTGTNCVAPVDDKYNLPAACVGSFFDETLDGNLGYKDASEFSFGDDLALLEFDGVDAQNGTLARRGFSIKGAFRAVGNAAKNTFNKTKDKAAEVMSKAKKDVVSAGEKLVSATVTVVEATKSAVEIVGNIIAGKPNTFGHNFDKLLLPRSAKECKDAESDPKQKDKMKNACKPADESGAKSVKSPWDGDAILIRAFGDKPDPKEMLTVGTKRQRTATRGKFINFYCVKCGLSGSAKTKGSITIVPTQGITEGFLQADLDLTVGIGLGIYAQYYYEDKFRANLFNIPVTPFTIGLVSFGPMISIGTELTYSLNMTGSALARADMSIARATLKYDWKNGGMATTGFTPEFRPSFEAQGEVTAAVQFGLPVGLEFGLSTAKGCDRCKGSIGIETVPAIKAQIAVGVEVSGNRTNGTNYVEGGLKTINNCTGISTTLSVLNDVNGAFNGFGLVKKSWPLIKGADKVLASYCIGNKTDGTDNGRIHKRVLSPTMSYDFSRRDLNSSSTANETSSATNDTSTSTSTSSDGRLYDLTKFVVDEVDGEGFVRPATPAAPYDMDEMFFEGYWYSTLSLQDSEGEYVLATCSDGNLYVQRNNSQHELDWDTTCSTLWSGFEDTVFFTPSGGILHYYNNTMSKVGVSRLRASDSDVLPDTSVYVNLAPFYYDETAAEGEGPSILAAIDPEDNLFFPVVCTYKDASSAKIYLVNADIEAGIQMLQSTDLKYTVTNGDVDKCYLLRLSVTNRGEGDWAEWDDEVVAAYEEDPLVWTFDDSLFGEDDDDWAWLDELLLDLEHLDWSDEDLLAIWGDLMFEDDDWEYLDEEDAWDFWFDYDETEEEAASEAA